MHSFKSWNLADKFNNKQSSKLILERSRGQYGTFLSPSQKYGQKRSLSLSALNNQRLLLNTHLGRQPFTTKHNIKQYNSTFYMADPKQKFLNNHNNTALINGQNLQKNGKNSGQMKSQFRQQLGLLNQADQTRKKYQREIQELRLHVRSAQEQNLHLIAKRDQDLQIISRQNQQILLLQHQIHSMGKTYQLQNNQECQCQTQQYQLENNKKRHCQQQQTQKIRRELIEAKSQCEKYRLQLQNLERTSRQKNNRPDLSSYSKERQNYRLTSQQSLKIALLLNQINNCKKQQIDRIDSILY